MERTSSHCLAVADAAKDAAMGQCCEALVFDGTHRSRRPVFALMQHLQRLADGRWQACREWRGVGDDLIAHEQVWWQRGLQRSVGELPAIGEQTQAVCAERGCLTALRSHRTGGVSRERSLTLPHAAATLGSMPLLIAQQWTTLMRGRPVLASYLVLKVQRAATVRLRRESTVAGQTVVAVTPTNLLLRALFGSTRYVFETDTPRLLRIEGLLDPRDLKPNGRWREYRGTIAFGTALDLSGLVGGAQP